MTQYMLYTGIFLTISKMVEYIMSVYLPSKILIFKYPIKLYFSGKVSNRPQVVLREEYLNPMKRNGHSLQDALTGSRGVATHLCDLTLKGKSKINKYIAPK